MISSVYSPFWPWLSVRSRTTVKVARVATAMATTWPELVLLCLLCLFACASEPLKKKYPTQIYNLLVRAATEIPAVEFQGWRANGEAEIPGESLRGREISYHQPLFAHTAPVDYLLHCIFLVVGYCCYIPSSACAVSCSCTAVSSYLLGAVPFLETLCLPGSDSSFCLALFWGSLRNPPPPSPNKLINPTFRLNGVSLDLQRYSASGRTWLQMNAVTLFLCCPVNPMTINRLLNLVMCVYIQYYLEMQLCSNSWLMALYYVE